MNNNKYIDHLKEKPQQKSFKLILYSSINFNGLALRQLIFHNIKISPI